MKRNLFEYFELILVNFVVKILSFSTKHLKLQVIIS